MLKYYLATVQFLMFVLANWSEAGACDNTRLPDDSAFSDRQVASDRTFQGANFYSASVIELLLICTCILLSRKTSYAHDLKGSARWVPVFIIVLNMSCRARYVYSTPYDSKACNALGCPDTHTSYSFPQCVLGDGKSAYVVKWGMRKNWCPVPDFYQKNPYLVAACGGLKNTPDVASCYRYGCTSQTGIRYNIVRVLIWNAFLFATVVLVPYTAVGVPENAPHTQDPGPHVKGD